MTAEDRNRYGVDVAELHPGSRLYHRDIRVVAVDWPDLEHRTIAVAYGWTFVAGTAPDLTVSTDDVSA
ncbi:Uncharacterised protein (plasmid) [Tsukamurella tyrosinosolvens]|uniref:Uncharacterized protein n=1 Tax=Tsukamurella tyrosinosolvens TaxID=57704 RepID=A0A1H4UYK8_TSUTY|nr:hypothetical protein [Tsukamurella tyrosinosolvens]KXO98420.1 hypothetical protein AXK58_25440 [Tsukamurella tyrosinosolvens]SEC73640.1 hypothetical protein SAMN04489793_3077 [Tsukamurella tyrosinosolvens]VEH90807.1 Uncharacterised protein [Tsukamurella tyrosinosolvens]